MTTSRSSRVLRPLPTDDPKEPTAGTSSGAAKGRTTGRSQTSNTSNQSHKRVWQAHLHLCVMNSECRTCCIERVRHVSDTELSPKSKPEAVQRSEVFTGAGRRRTWTTEQKAQIVAESYESGEPVSAVARADCPAAIRLALRSTAAGGRGCRRERVGLCASDRGSNFAMREGTGRISGARRAVTDGRDCDWRRHCSDSAGDCRRV